MLNRSLVALSFAAMSSCAPTLYLHRNLPPLADPAAVQQVEVTTRSDLGRQAGTAVMSTVMLGRVDVPISVEGLVRDEVARQLPGVGVQVCAQSPCPQTPSVLNAYIVESTVGPQVDSKGVTTLRAKLTVRFEIVGRDGRRFLDRAWSDGRSAGVLYADRLMPDASRDVVGHLARAFLPRQYTVAIPLEDGGPLDPGVNKLLAGDAQGARADFEALVASPEGSAAAWYDLGVCGEVQGDWQLAVRGYRGAAERLRKDLYLEALQKAEPEAAQAPTPQLGAPVGPLP